MVIITTVVVASIFLGITFRNRGINQSLTILVVKIVNDQSLELSKEILNLQNFKSPLCDTAHFRHLDASLSRDFNDRRNLTTPNELFGKRKRRNEFRIPYLSYKNCAVTWQETSDK